MPANRYRYGAWQGGPASDGQLRYLRGIDWAQSALHDHGGAR